MTSLILLGVLIFQSMFSKTCFAITSFLMFELMMEFSLSVHSVPLPYMNTDSVFHKPWPSYLRLFTFICGTVFVSMVIDWNISFRVGSQDIFWQHAIFDDIKQEMAFSCIWLVRSAAVTMNLIVSRRILASTDTTYSDWVLLADLVM